VQTHLLRRSSNPHPPTAQSQRRAAPKGTPNLPQTPAYTPTTDPRGQEHSSTASATSQSPFRRAPRSSSHASHSHTRKEPGTRVRTHTKRARVPLGHAQLVSLVRGTKRVTRQLETTGARTSGAHKDPSPAGHHTSPHSKSVTQSPRRCPNPSLSRGRTHAMDAPLARPQPSNQSPHRAHTRHQGAHGARARRISAPRIGARRAMCNAQKRRARRTTPLLAGHSLDRYHSRSPGWSWRPWEQ